MAGKSKFISKARLFTFIKLFVICGVLSANQSNDTEPKSRIIFQEHGQVFAPTEILHVTFNIDNEHLHRSCIRYTQFSQELAMAIKTKDISEKDRQNLQTQLMYIAQRITDACRTPYSFATVARDAKNAYEGRKPRAFGIIALFAGAFAASTGLGIYNNAQINNLYTQVQELQENMNYFKDNFLLLQDIQTRLASIQQDLDHAATSMEELVKLVKTEYVTILHIQAALSEFSDHVNQLDQIISKFERGYTQLQNGKLSIDLIDPEQLTNVWKTIQNNSSSSVQALFPSPLDLLSLPASYAFTHSNKLQIFVHVPLRATQFTLYRYVPFPLIPAGASVPVMLRPKNNKYFLAKVDNSYVHTELSHTDLASNCYQYLHNYICNELSVFHSMPTSSCLSSLYHADQAGINNLCDVTNFPGVFASHNIERNTFLIYSREPITYKIKCPTNDTTQGELLLDHKIIKVPQFCYIEALNFYIQSTAVTQLKQTSTFPVFLNFSRLIDSTDIKEVEIVHQELSQLREPEMKIKEIVEKARLAYRTTTMFPHMGTNIALVALATVVMFTLTCIACCGALIKKQIKKKMHKLLQELQQHSPPIYPPKTNDKVT